MKKYINSCCLIWMLFFAGSTIAQTSTTTNSGFFGIATNTQFAINGNYDNNGGILDIEIGTATENNLLTATNNITLSGTLVIHLVNGFVPTNAQSFVIMTGAAVNGIFDSISFPTGYLFTINYNATTVVLSNFRVATNTITASAGSGGSISPGGITTVQSGANKTYSITPDANSCISDIIVDGISVGTADTYTFNNVIASHTITANFTQKIIAGISINASATSICSGVTATFTASANNAGTNAAYQWKKNGINVGSNSNVYSTNTVSNGDSIWCVLTTNNPCTTTPTVISNKIKMTVNIAPSITSGATFNCVLGTSTPIYANAWNTVWTSSNPAVATISYPGPGGTNSAYINAVSNGSTTISLTTASNISGCNATINYNVAAVTIPPIIVPSSSLCLNNSMVATNALNNGVWSFNNSRATVTNSGLITAYSVGTGILKYTSATNSFGCSNSATQNIVINPLPAQPVINITPGISNSNAIPKNKTYQFSFSPAGGVWSSSNPAVATVSNAGLMQTISGGTATISYTYTNSNGCSSVRSFTGTVLANKAANINNGEPSLNIGTGISFSLYPNPAQSVVSLKVDKMIGEGIIVITDVYGKTIKSYALRQAQGDTNVQTLDISTLSKGIYLVNVITNDGKVTKKLIVE